MISIRKLAAVDMAWLGTRLILGEYAAGVVLPLALGLLSLRAGLRTAAVFNGETVVGAWLIGIAANYVPLLIYSILLTGSGQVEAEGRPELARAKRYGTQQVIILVPLLVVIVALMQESQRRSS